MVRVSRRDGKTLDLKTRSYPVQQGPLEKTAGISYPSYELPHSRTARKTRTQSPIAVIQKQRRNTSSRLLAINYWVSSVRDKEATRVRATNDSAAETAEADLHTPSQPQSSRTTLIDGRLTTSYVLPLFKLSTVSRSKFNSLLRVLFNFRSHYLFAIEV